MTSRTSGRRTLLCDADGNLFPSEEPAFAASVAVVNAFLRHHHRARRLDADEQRRASTGKNFRAFLSGFCDELGIELSAAELADWVGLECDAVTAHLGHFLTPDPQVRVPVSRLARRYRLAAVSSSACRRLDRCFTVTSLADLFPADRRFSCEDSLAVPVSKPDPAIYDHACRQLGVAPAEALAVEDSVPGVLAAVAAGVPTVGNVQFVSAAERRERVPELRRAGAIMVVASWSELDQRLRKWPALHDHDQKDSRGRGGGTASTGHSARQEAAEAVL